MHFISRIRKHAVRSYSFDDHDARDDGRDDEPDDAGVDPGHSYDGPSDESQDDADRNVSGCSGFSVGARLGYWAL
jgi:hypothetical protein